MVAIAVVLSSLAVLACESGEPTQAEREEVSRVVRAFVERLAEAYSGMDPAPLEGLVTPRFMERARHDIDLLRAGGDRLEPRLKNLEILSLKVLRRTNAYVAAREIWDTKRFDAFTGELVGHDPDSVLHSHIQLQRVDRRWVVLYREVEETATGPRFVVKTPGPS